jgi:hypothetical protein
MIQGVRFAHSRTAAPEYVACALPLQACRKGHRATYRRATR